MYKRQFPYIGGLLMTPYGFPAASLYPPHHSGRQLQQERFITYRITEIMKWCQCKCMKLIYITAKTKLCIHIFTAKTKLCVYCKNKVMYTYIYCKNEVVISASIVFIYYNWGIILTMQI